jgi:hypothetical protein
MSKLSEILAARKAAANAQPILQSETGKTASAQSIEAVKKPSILDKLRGPNGNKQPTQNNSVLGEKGSAIVEEIAKAPINELSSSEKTISANDKGQSNNVAANANSNELLSGNKTTTEISSAPQKPLSLLQRKLLEKKNASVQNVNSATSSANSQNSSQQTTQISPAERPAVSEPVQTLSASQSADALKQNDGSANIEELKSNLKYLAENIENRELVAQVVRTIALQLKNNRELTPHMANSDVNLMVRGLKAAYATAAFKKQEKSEKRTKTQKGADELSAMFKDAGIDFKF